MAFTEVELLARTILCEAGGEGDTGMKAVATVIMNRVNVDYGEYAKLKTIREVIYQPGQFDCVRESLRGSYNAQNVYNMRPGEVHYNIAEWAMAGSKVPNIGFCLWYFNPFKPDCRQFFPSEVGRFVIRIGDHCFYDPTPVYAKT